MRAFALLLALTGTGTSLAAPAAVAQTRPPNIVVIVADDMGYADTGPYGSKDIPTPNIDALAAGGIRFTDAYVSGPYCSPTRAGLLTGRYPQRFGHEYNIGIAAVHREAGLPLEEVTMADRLRSAGYRTALIGKWHLGAAPRFFPTRRGFDEFFGFLGGTHAYVAPTPERNPLYDGTSIVRTSPLYLTDTLASRAVEFIQRNREGPFFLYLAFNAVHVPLQATPQYLSRFSQVGDSTRRVYAAMLSAMDDGIGRTLAAIRDERLEENTLIFFFSDNGGPTDSATWNGSSNGVLRGDKGQTWEGGIRVPFIVRWKGRIAEGRTDARPIIQLDVLPTALAAAGVPIRPEWRLDGVNLLPLLTGVSRDAAHDALYWRAGGVMAVRVGKWKLVRSYERGVSDPVDSLKLEAAELFNLEDDVGETHNLAAQFPDKARELADVWRRWNAQLATPAWPPPPGGRGAAPIR